jgi:hypothetical protein
MGDPSVFAIVFYQGSGKAPGKFSVLKSVKQAHDDRKAIRGRIAELRPGATFHDSWNQFYAQTDIDDEFRTLEILSIPKDKPSKRLQ